jgi:hypothetical protein
VLISTELFSTPLQTKSFNFTSSVPSYTLCNMNNVPEHLQTSKGWRMLARNSEQQRTLQERPGEHLVDTLQAAPFGAAAPRVPIVPDALRREHSGLAATAAVAVAARRGARSRTLAPGALTRVRAGGAHSLPCRRHGPQHSSLSPTEWLNAQDHTQRGHLRQTGGTSDCTLCSAPQTTFSATA